MPSLIVAATGQAARARFTECPMASVTLEHVSKAFRDGRRTVFAVRDFNLYVADGEMVVLVGPSGCGKTTTLRIIAGLEEASEGTIRIGNRVVNRVPPRRRDVAMVFQSGALYPHLTAYDNLAFPLRMQGEGRGEIDARVRETAGLLGLDRLLHRKPAELSGGERQRVALGRAMVRRPRVFLFDEPLSNLDAPSRARMRGELRALQRRLAVTAIYVTHDQEEAMSLGDRLAVMKEGRLQQIGAPLDLYDRPASRFVAAVVGSPAMNFVEGRLDVGGAAFLPKDGGVLALPAGLVERAAKAGGGAGVWPAVLGIRAENVTVLAAEDDAAGGGGDGREAGGAGRAVVRMTVRGVEPLGDRTWVHLDAPWGDLFVAREGPRRPAALAPAAAVRIALDLHRAHLFADDAEGRLLA